MAEEPEVKVVRIVNLGDTFNKPTLKDFLQQMVSPEGNIEDLYIKKDYRLKLVYAYVIFEKGCDASKTVTTLNNFTYEATTFDAALIAPELPCRKYVDIDKPRVINNDNTKRPTLMERLKRARATYPNRFQSNISGNWRDRKDGSQNKRDRSTEEVTDIGSKKRTAIPLFERLLKVTQKIDNN